MPISSPNIATNSAPPIPYSFSGVSGSGSDFATSSSLSSKNNGIFGFSAPMQATSSIFSASNSSLQNSSIGAGESTSVAQATQSGSGTSLFSQSSTSQLGYLASSATPGLSSSSSLIFGSSPSSMFGINSSSLSGLSYASFSTSNQSVNLFSSPSGFPFSSSNLSTSSSKFSFSSANVVSGLSYGFTLSSIASGSNASSERSCSTGLSTLRSAISFSASAPGSQTPASSNSLPAATPTLFGSTSLGSVFSYSSCMFCSSPSTGFSFGLSAPASEFSFGASSGSVFSFASSGSTMSAATATPVYGMHSPAGGLCSISQNNDQMSVEDTMADDTSQAPAPTVPTFGQPNSAPASSNFVFGSTVPSGGAPFFQFGSQQNASVLHNANLFQDPEGSFYLGSVDGGRNARKFVKLRRDKIRRK